MNDLKKPVDKKKTNVKIKTTSPQETENLGMWIGRNAEKGSVFCLMGDLGAGKTTFLKGLCRGLGVPEEHVTSPTFQLMNVYQDARVPVYHFDLYRLEDPDELEEIGFESYADPNGEAANGVVLIEWADKFLGLMPENYLALKILPPRKQNEAGTAREFYFSVVGDIAKYKPLLKNMLKALAVR